jgi:hypothetical protein
MWAPEAKGRNSMSDSKIKDLSASKEMSEEEMAETKGGITRLQRDTLKKSSELSSKVAWQPVNWSWGLSSIDRSKIKR